MKVRFYGVRGSIATPGSATYEVGGNTSCVSVEIGDSRFVFDAGSGLRRLGEDLVESGPRPLHLLLSHIHWDHIQGLPFFRPLYTPGFEIDIYSGPNGFMPLAQALRKQMAPPFFPVAFDDCGAKIRTHDFSKRTTMSIEGAKVTTLRLHHPDPCYAYRIDANGLSVVYATDTEHFSCVDPALRQLCEHADLLIYDAQYTPEEYAGLVGPSRVGWGHSTYQAAAQLAKAAKVKQLALFHHDPTRSDSQIEKLEERARCLFPRSFAAREAMEIQINSQLSLDSKAA